MKEIRAHTKKKENITIPIKKLLLFKKCFIDCIIFGVVVGFMAELVAGLVILDLPTAHLNQLKN